MENGRCSYRRLSSCSSSGFPSASSSPALQPMPSPPATATALDEPNNSFAPTLHGHLLPPSLADASTIAHNGSTGSFVPQIEVSPPMDGVQHPHPAISYHDLQNFWEQHLSSQPGGVHQSLPYFYTYNYSTTSSHGSLVGALSPAAMDQPWASSPDSTFGGSYDGGFTSPSYASASPGGWSPTPSHSTHEGAYDDYLVPASHLEGPSTQRR